MVGFYNFYGLDCVEVVNFFFFCLVSFKFRLVKMFNLIMYYSSAIVIRRDYYYFCKYLKVIKIMYMGNISYRILAVKYERKSGVKF